MARTPKDVTDAELSLLRQLWDRGPASIRQLTDELYSAGSVSHYATVQKLLDRLEAKGYVRRDRRANVHLFSAAIQRDDLIGHRIKALAENLCNGSMAPILSHLVRSQPLSAEDRKSLRELIDRLDTKAPGSRR